MSANAPSQTVFSIGYDFHLGNGTSGTDNGNVFGITNYKDTTLAMSANARSQTVFYSILTTRSLTLGNLSNTAGSWPGTISRGEATSCFIRSWARRLDAASSVWAMG